MRDIGVHDEIVQLFSVTQASIFLLLSEPSYPALTSELLATISADITSCISKNYVDGTISFSMGNQQWSLTLDQVNTALNLRPYRATLDVSDDHLSRIWYKITGRDSFVVRSDGYVKYMVHPIFKIIQRILANTIFGREECSKIMSPELQSLYCMTHGMEFDLGYEFVKKLLRLSSASTKGAIVIGGLVTRIAKALDIDLSGYEAIPPTYIDIGHLRNAKIIDSKESNGLYLTKNPVTERFSAITPELVPLSNRRNWYNAWSNKRRLKRPENDSEPEPEEEEDESEDEEDESEEEEGDDDDTPAALPSQPSSSYHYDPSNPPWEPRLSNLEAQMSRVLSMQEHMYYKSFGYYYDPNAPFPPPPEGPP